MNGWTHIHLEAYCLFNSMSQEYQEFRELDISNIEKSLKSEGPYEKTLNKNYVHKSNKPAWCRNNNKKMLPRFRCMCDGKNDKRCPFFAMCDCDPKDYKLFDKAYNEKYKEVKQ